MTLMEVESRLAAVEAEVAELREQLEKSQIAAAMERSREQFLRGEAVPAIEAAQSLARKYGIAKS